MKSLIHKILYRALPLDSYLRTVSRLFFLSHRLGIGRYNTATEYVYHLPQLIKPGAVAIDIGANLGYYAKPLSQIVGHTGMVYAVEPVKPVFEVLKRNLRGCQNVELLNYALGTEEHTIRMGNDSARETGYFGTGQNFVNENDSTTDVEFLADMRCGSQLFGELRQLDFIKCDIEGYEVVVMYEMRPVLKHFRPTVLIETGGKNRPLIISLFSELGYMGYTLEHGREIPLLPDTTKDIIFRPR